MFFKRYIVNATNICRVFLINRSSIVMNGLIHSRLFFTPFNNLLPLPSSNTKPKIQQNQQRMFVSKKKNKKVGKKAKNKKDEEEEEEQEVEEDNGGLEWNDINTEKEEEEKERIDLASIESKANTIIEKLKKEYSTMRIGRANPAILDSVVVPYGGGSAPLKDLAQIVVKDPQTLLVRVHEEEILQAVDKAIRSANLNLNPMIDNKGLKVPIPKITTEYRENMVKTASKMAENAKIKIRLVRQDGLKELKKIKTGISADEIKGLEKKFQLVIDKSVKDIDEILKAKSKEITTN